jgi:hypothetical protein
MENDKDLLRQELTSFVSKVSPVTGKPPKAVKLKAVFTSPEHHEIYAKFSLL